MKKIVTSCLLLVLAATTFSQQTNPAIQTDYLRKSKNQKTAAWIFLGGGLALVITAAAIPKGESTGLEFNPFTIISEGHENDEIKAVLALSGLVSMLGSIPFFVASGKNKRLAARFSFRLEKTGRLQPGGLAGKRVPSLAIKIAL
jgi:hypothetical protein